MTGFQRLGYFMFGVLLAALLVVGTAWDWLQQSAAVSVRADQVCRGDCAPDRASTSRFRCLGCF